MGNKKDNLDKAFAITMGMLLGATISATKFIIRLKGY